MVLPANGSIRLSNHRNMGDSHQESATRQWVEYALDDKCWPPRLRARGSHSSTRAKTVAVPKVTPAPADGISAASNKQRLARRPTALRLDYLISAEEATAAIGTFATSAIDVLE